MNFNKFCPVFAPCFQGQRKTGVEFGSSYLYNNIFFKNTVTKPIEIKTADFNSTDGYVKLFNICSNNFYPLVLGGDHSIGYSTVLASMKKYKENLSVIWIDAHGDINTMVSSITKSKHGTPLAPVTGLEEHWFNNDVKAPLDFSKIIYVGIRDLDIFEVNILKKHNVKHYSPQETVNYITETNDNIHISFDVDAIDPLELDSTGTMAPNGLNYIDVKNIINTSINTEKLIALDVVEFNPYLGNLNNSLMTMNKIFL